MNKKSTQYSDSYVKDKGFGWVVMVTILLVVGYFSAHEYEEWKINAEISESCKCLNNVKTSIVRGEPDKDIKEVLIHNIEARMIELDC